MLREQSRFGGFGQRVFFLFCFAGGLQTFEFRRFAFAPTGKTVFLQREIAKFLFVTQADFAFERQMRLGGISVGGIFGDEFGAFDGEDRLARGRGFDLDAILGRRWIVQEHTLRGRRVGTGIGNR